MGLSGGAGQTSATTALLDYQHLMQHAIRFLLTAVLSATAAGSFGAESRVSLYAPATCHDVMRAGYPWHVGDWAKPTNTCAYSGYYVGGGSCRNRNDCRCPDQGTWGWDY